MFSYNLKTMFYYLKDLERIKIPVYSIKGQVKISVYRTGNKIHKAKQ